MSSAIDMQLRHVFNVSSGATPKSGVAEYWDGDIRWATPQDLGKLEGYWLKNTRRKITQAGYDSCGATTAPIGAIILTKRAPIGELAVLEKEVCCNQGCFLLTPRCDTDTRFFYYWLFTKKEYLQVLGRGSTFMELSTDDLKALHMPFPLVRRQREIADYLDSAMKQIDALITAKERVLSLLLEKCRTLIFRAVTTGIDPDVKMKKSSFAWSGEIPKHWEIKRAKWLFRERDERSNTGEEVLLSLRMDIGLIPHNEVSEKKTQAEDLIGYKKVDEGEIVLNRMRAAIGLVAVSPHDGLVSPDYAVFHSQMEIEPQYYTHLFKTDLLQSLFRSESKGLGTGSSGFLRLYSDKFLSFWLPCPPYTEQMEIVAYIAHETKKLDTLYSATERTISLLKERRSALIAAAVTGKIQVEEKS